MKQKYYFLKIFLFILIVLPKISFAEEAKGIQHKLRIGYLGSLSGFAASYGNSVLEGINLAVVELKKEGKDIELEIEDDSSESKNTVTAYRNLVDLKKVQLFLQELSMMFGI